MSGIGDVNSSSFTRAVALRTSSLMWLLPRAGVLRGRRSERETKRKGGVENCFYLSLFSLFRLFPFLLFLFSFLKIFLVVAGLNFTIPLLTFSLISIPLSSSSAFLQAPQTPRGGKMRRSCAHPRARTRPGIWCSSSPTLGCRGCCRAGRLWR